MGCETRHGVCEVQQQVMGGLRRRQPQDAAAGAAVHCLAIKHLCVPLALGKLGTVGVEADAKQ